MPDAYAEKRALKAKIDKINASVDGILQIDVQIINKPCIVNIVSTTLLKVFKNVLFIFKKAPK